MTLDVYRGRKTTTQQLQQRAQLNKVYYFHSSMYSLLPKDLIFQNLFSISVILQHADTFAQIQSTIHKQDAVVLQSNTKSPSGVHRPFIK